MRLIDADTLKEVIYNNLYTITDFFNSQDRGMFWTGGIEKAIDEAPTIEAEPVRQGHWIKVGCSHFGDSTYECSVCHYVDVHNESREVPYCWQCGARMENDDNM